MKSNSIALSRNYEWYVQADTERYSGEWIAIVDGEVVASGNDAEKVYDEAERKYPGKELSIAKVPDKQILVFGGELW